MSSMVKAALISVVLFAIFGTGLYFLFRVEDKPLPETPRSVDVATPEEPFSTTSPPKQSALKDIVQPPSPGDVTVSVRVVEQATGKLLPKASLLVQKLTDGDSSGERVFESGRRGGANTGEFLVSLPPGMYQFRAQCPGYGSKMEKVTLLKDRKRDVVLELGRGNSISGRVLTRAGRGIGGARVLAYTQIGNPDASLLERLIGITEVQENAQKIAGEAVSADDGSYQIDGLEKKYYSVKAVAARHTPAERSKILPSQENVNFQLSPGGELNGVVVDAATGAPVNGAKVMAYNHLESSDIFAIIETRSRPPFDTVTTQDGGQFKFETLGAGVYNFVVAAPTYQEGRFLKIRVREGDNSPQRFTITKGLSISGSVVSAENEPIAGAKVRATRIGDTGQREQIFIKFDDGSITTDARGRFHFDTLEPGKYTLLAWHRDHSSEQQRDVDAGAQDLVITLPQGGAVAGSITQAGTGKPIPGARVSVSDIHDLRKEAITDEKGDYYVAGLSVEGQGSKRYLNVYAEGYARLSNVQIQVENGKVDDRQNFELVATALVSGKVVNSDGQGISGARVMAKRKGGQNPVPLTVGSAVTNEDGTFQIKDLEAGEEAVLSVLTGDYLEEESAPFIVGPGEFLELPDLVLRLGGMVEGIVVGPDGRPAPGVQVQVRKEGETTPDPALSASTDNRGQFRLRGLPAGTVDLVTKSIHHLEELVAGVKVAEGLITKDVRIVLKQGSHIRGTVLDGDGKPVPDAQVVIQDISETGGLKELRATTEHDGSFSVENILAAEAVEVQVEHPDHGFWSSERVTVNTSDLKVKMPRLGGVRAVVVDSAGKPISSFSVQPEPKDSSAARKLVARTYQSGPANRDGSFVYSGIPAGLYDVHVRAPGYSAFTFPRVEMEGEMMDLGKAVLQEGGILSGTVTDASGNPLPGASLRVLGGMVKFNLSPGGVKPSSPKTSGDQSVTVTDNRGLFEFRNLKGGSVSLQVTAKGYVSKRVENLDPNLAEKSRDVKIVLEEGAEIFGAVIDADGNAKNGISVYLTGVGEVQNRADLNQRTATNSEGKFQFQGLSPGVYRVTAQRVGQKSGEENPSVEVPIEAGLRQEVELVFE